MISFLRLCLLSRFERYQGDGGPDNIDKFLGSLLNSIIENIEGTGEDIEESKGLRFPRGLSGPQRAAKDRRDKKAAAAAEAAAEIAETAAEMEQAERRAQRSHLIKLTSSCANDVGFQVLFLSSLLRDFLFPVWWS